LAEGQTYLVFTLLSTIALKLVYAYHYMKKYALQYIENKNKNIFNNLLRNVSRCTCTLIFQKLPSPHCTRTRTWIEICTHAS